MLNKQTNDTRLITFKILLLLAVLVNVCTINTAFFTDDPGLYGSIAKQLIYKHRFFELFSYGRDWLDKVRAGGARRSAAAESLRPTLREIFSGNAMNPPLAPILSRQSGPSNESSKP